MGRVEFSREFRAGLARFEFDRNFVALPVVAAVDDSGNRRYSGPGDGFASGTFQRDDRLGVERSDRVDRGQGAVGADRCGEQPHGREEAGERGHDHAARTKVAAEMRGMKSAGPAEGDDRGVFGIHPLLPRSLPERAFHIRFHDGEEGWGSAGAARERARLDKSVQ